MRLKRACVVVPAVSARSGCAAEADRNEAEAAAGASSTSSTPTAPLPSTPAPTLAHGAPIDPLVFCEALLADKVLPNWEKSGYGLDMAGRPARTGRGPVPGHPCINHADMKSPAQHQ
jgi:hypothetical protein